MWKGKKKLSFFVIPYVNISNELKQMSKVKLYNIKNTYIGKEHKNVRKIGEFIIKLGTYFYQKTS